MKFDDIKKMEKLGYSYRYCELCGGFIAWGSGDCSLIHDDCTDNPIDELEKMEK